MFAATTTGSALSSMYNSYPLTSLDAASGQVMLKLLELKAQTKAAAGVSVEME